MSTKIAAEVITYILIANVTLDVCMPFSPAWKPLAFAVFGVMVFYALQAGWDAARSKPPSGNP